MGLRMEEKFKSPTDDIVVVVAPGDVKDGSFVPSYKRVVWGDTAILKMNSFLFGCLLRF